MQNTKIDLSKYQNALSRKNQMARLLWTLVWAVFARPLPRSLGNSWKIFLKKSVIIRPSLTVYKTKTQK